jgi:multicomponent Na+:H+ antiporter subunit D
MFSGVVVKAGVFPLVRCALLLEELDPIIRLFGVCTALFGVACAVFEKDTKRMLAFHTISQLGFVLAAPLVAGFYALTHGLVKAALFLLAGNLPSRNFKQLQSQPINNSIWIALVIASFSISGFPLLSGFGAKVLTSKNYLPWQIIAMNIVALGTAISFAKFIFLPYERNKKKGNIRSGLWAAMVILLGGLVVANGFYFQAYTVKNLIKPLVTIVIGWLCYLFIIKKLNIKFPRVVEEFDHIIGVMSIMAVVLFWIVWTQLRFSISP